MEPKETKQMAGMETEEACCRTERTPAERKKLLTRLKTIEGQITVSYTHLTLPTKLEV
mgnify:CR=1 FL=1